MNKQPYWIRKTHLLKPDEYICSVCRAVCDRPSAYCPRCGSKMGKTKKDGTWILEAELLDMFFDDED